jgi:chitodextrinase
MWNAASTGDRRRSLGRVGWIGILVALALLPVAAAGDNSGDKKAPKAPTNVTVGAATTTSLTFVWEGSPAASERAGADGYTIYRGETVVATTPETRYTIENLSCGTTYTFAIDAFDLAGNRSDRVPAQGTTAACLPAPPPPPPPPPADTQPPTQPGSPIVTGAVQTSISISWPASSDNVGVAGYALFLNNAQGSPQQVGTTTSLSYTFGNLACGKPYTLSVSAFDAAGNASSKAQLNASTAACLPQLDTTPPSAPGSLTKTGADALSISISWSQSTDNVAVAGYTVFRDGTSVGSTTATNYAVGGLQCGMTVTLGVLAYDAAGNTSATSPLTASTAACATPPPSGSAFYVSPLGSDSNPGTLAAPWRTVQKAFDALDPGQTALVRAGNYSPATCGPEDSGTAGNDVTVKAYPGEQPVMAGAVDGVLRVTCSYLRFQGFKLAGPACLNCTIMYGKSGSHVTLADNEITGSVCQGMNLSSVTTDWVVVGNRVHDNGFACDEPAHGMYVQGARHLIANNLIYDTHDYGIHLYPVAQDVRLVGNTIVRSGRSGIIMGGSGGVSGAVVVNNILANNAEWGVRPYAGLSSCDIHGNLTYGNPKGGLQATGFPAGCPGANMNANPLLAPDLTVASNSPAVDAADRAQAVSPAFGGDARPQGAGPDIGAFERRT